MPTTQHPLIFIFLIMMCFYITKHGQRLIVLESQQETSVHAFSEFKDNLAAYKEEITEINSERENIRELIGNAHLYIAALENQVISLKEDIKQCERKKLN